MAASDTINTVSTIANGYRYTGIRQKGVYSLTGKDRRIIHCWQSKRQNGGIDLTLAGLVALSGVCILLLLGVM